MARPSHVPSSLTVTPFRGGEAVRAGLLTKGQLRGATWVRLLPDIYLYAEIPVDHRVMCEAAMMLLPPGAAIGGTSAAWLWGARPLGEPRQVTALVPRTCRMRDHPPIRIRRGPLAPKDITTVLGLAVSTPERTAFDIARLLPRTEAAVHLDTMLKKRKVRLDRLTSYVADHPGWPGRPRADEVLTLVEPLAESPMETLLRLLIVDAGLPRPVAQYAVMRGKRFVARLDYAYPDYRIALEYDGDHHRDRVTHRFDMERQNELHVMGWTVLRFNADDVLRRPAQTAALIRAVLRRAGHPAV
ncbi:MAG: DUF559 domain-containing protein [Hamadaea sp.]|nr:DUF559 domain-containing protein [Hamadaea sp.]